MNPEDERASDLKVWEDCTYGNKTLLKARGIVEAIIALKQSQAPWVKRDLRDVPLAIKKGVRDQTVLDATLKW